MSAAIGKLFNPATYSTLAISTRKAAYEYYHPLMRNNSATPLWHAMLGVSAIMYTCTYVSRVYPEQQEKRAIQRLALKEYYEKHGGGEH